MLCNEKIKSLFGDPKARFVSSTGFKGQFFFQSLFLKGQRSQGYRIPLGKKSKKMENLALQHSIFFHSFICDFFLKSVLFNMGAFLKVFFYGSHIKRSPLQKLCMVLSSNAPSFSFSPQDCYIFYFPKWTEFLCCVSLSWREAE